MTSRFSMKTCFAAAILLIGPVLSYHFQKEQTGDVCTSKEFQCYNGKCTATSGRCDGILNCEDGSDELHCDLRYESCKSPEFFKCIDEKKCLNSSYKCDGHADCDDDSDEKDCKVTKVEKMECEIEGYFKCLSNGTCISPLWVCDGKKDCYDGMDETIGCEQRKSCDPSHFMCRNHHCVKIENRCDGSNDCGDESDEDNCGHKKLDMKDCTLDNRKYACADGFKCIDISKVCDNIHHCYDSSDESTSCHSSGDLCKNMNCSHECVITPKGPACVCPSGSVFDNKSCVDVNECKEIGICDQNCENKFGGYRCSCVDGYNLQADGKTCKADNGSSALLLYISESSEIKIIDVEAKSNHLMIANAQQATGIATDGGNIYWSVVRKGSQAIIKSNEDGSKQEKIVTSGLGSPEDIAYDWITKNLYFTDVKMKHIGVCTNDGNACAILHDKDIDKPRAIALSPTRGILYWSDWGKSPIIGKCNMDGSNVIDFVTDNIHWPNGIVIDEPTNRLYWVDAKIKVIESITLDGEDRQVVAVNSIEHPFSIAIFENMLYWSDWDREEILSCNKFTGKNMKVIAKEQRHRIYGMKMYHPVLQLNVTNPCLNSGCSDLCLLTPATTRNNITFTCACPDDKILYADGKWCKDVGTPNMVITAVKNVIYLIEYEHLGRQKIVDIFLQNHVTDISALVYDPITESIIISDSTTNKILSYHIKTNTISPILSSGVEEVISMDFDHYGNNLYFCNLRKHTVEVFNFNTNTQGIIMIGSAIQRPMEIALVADKGWAFVTSVDTSSKVHIDRVSMNGSIPSITHFVETDIIGPVIYLHYDRYSKRLLWLDRESNDIHGIDIEGNSKRLFVVTVFNDDMSGIASLEKVLFWMSRSDLIWQHKSDDDTTNSLKLNIPSLKDNEQVKITSMTNSDDGSYHPCRINNGGCSHLCLVVSNTDMVCGCPSDLSLSGDKKKCESQPKCNEKQYRCITGECVQVRDLCNGYMDCPRGDDELQQNCRTVFCPEGQFLCHDQKKCIDMKKKCNRVFDCDDHSDELTCPKTCSPDRFLCGSGECINKEFECDDHMDCSDGTDEMNCAERRCKPNEFKCRSSQCIPNNWECDGDFDCVDGTDEHEFCKKEICKSTEFHCTNGNCVDIVLTCNGNNDCGDNSDEGAMCDSGLKHKKCNPITEFQCNDNVPHCLPISVRCNKMKDCKNGEDEYGCTDCKNTNKFKCQNGKCVPMEWLCDRTNDCEDNSDENEDSCMLKTSERDHHTMKSNNHTECAGFLCSNGKCLGMINAVCDGKDDCTDGSDEGGYCGKGCKEAACSHSCKEYPTGAKCNCKPGYILKEDGKTCEDINECKEGICAQICTNQDGDYVCDCKAPYYMLKSDRMSCKAIGDALRYVIATDDQVLSLSENLHHTKSLYSGLTGPSIMSIDVDSTRNKTYIAIENGIIMAVDMKYNIVHEFRDINIPTLITSDWLTGNVYYVEEHTTIVICNFNSDEHTAIYEANNKSNIYALTVDPIKGLLFWYEVDIYHPGTPDGLIKSSDCSGGNVTTVRRMSNHFVKYMEADTMDGYIYILNKGEHTIDRMKYDGSEYEPIVQVESNAISFGYFENTIYWVTNEANSYPVRRCKLYGPIPRKCDPIKIPYNGINHISIHQQYKHVPAENPCKSWNSSKICTNTPYGAVQICESDHSVPIGSSCDEGQKSEKDKHTPWIAYAILLISALVGFLLFFYYYYKPKSPIFSRLNFHNTMYDENLSDIQPVCFIPGQSSYENPLSQMPSGGIFKKQISVKKGGISFLETIVDEDETLRDDYKELLIKK